MGNGEWGMENEKWIMRNGEWGMGNGEWEIENKKLNFFVWLLSKSTFYFLQRSAPEFKDMIMREVTLPCFFISLPEAIFVIGRLVKNYFRRVYLSDPCCIFETISVEYT